MTLRRVSGAPGEAPPRTPAVPCGVAPVHGPVAPGADHHRRMGTEADTPVVARATDRPPPPGRGDTPPPEPIYEHERIYEEARARIAAISQEWNRTLRSFYTG